MSKYRLFVLILVVMDYSLVLFYLKLITNLVHILNPCCNGL